MINKRIYTNEIPASFQSPDIIYHYCDLNTAIEYILHDQKLRLSQRKNSNDPIENMTPSFTMEQTINVNQDNFPSEGNEDRKIVDLARDKIRSAKQLCFCMNDAEKTTNDYAEKLNIDEEVLFIKWESTGNYFFTKKQNDKMKLILSNKL